MAGTNNDTNSDFADEPIGDPMMLGCLIFAGPFFILVGVLVLLVMVT